jgi:hypothetical protein
MTIKSDLQKQVALAIINLREIEDQIADLPRSSIYPLYVQSNRDKAIVKFTGIETGEVIDVGNNTNYRVGDVSCDWKDHTDRQHWKPIAFNETRGLYDKQLVWCSDDERLGFSGCPSLEFYDAINNLTFTQSGHRDGFNWHNVTPAYIDEPWIQVAYNKLQD